MEIRNALKKIDNYLSVVQNLNKTILEEGTMAPDELKLMKKYLRGCIERIEEIEQKLNMTEPVAAAEEISSAIIPEEIVSLVDNNVEAEAFIEEEIKPELPTEVTIEEIAAPIVSEHIIIDPEQTRNEILPEPELVEEVLPVAEIEEVVEIAEQLPVIETVMETVTPPAAFQLVGEEETEEKIIGTEQKRSWADLWEDQSEPVNNGLVKEEDEVESIPVIEVPKNMFTQQNEPAEIRQPLVSLVDEEEEEVVHTIGGLKEETTVNDLIQTKKETGLFEMFNSQPENVSVKTYGSETQVQDVAETDVMVAELENKQPEFSVSQIFSQVRTGSEERIKAAKTLSESIALNDKFIFVRELFGNQFNEYENALRTLDSLHSYSEAESYCQQNLQEKFKWIDRPAQSEKFHALLDRRFSA